MVEKSYYDVAQICLNGHVINGSTRALPAKSRPFCGTCGMTTITACPACNSEIQGDFREEGRNDFFSGKPPGFYVDVTPLTSATPYCEGCGAAFPWTDAALAAAGELAELELSEADAAILIKSLVDVVKTSPRTEVAIFKLQKIFAKAGPAFVAALRDIMVDVLSEVVKRKLFPQP